MAEEVEGTWEEVRTSCVDDGSTSRMTPYFGTGGVYVQLRLGMKQGLMMRIMVNSLSGIIQKGYNWLIKLKEGDRD